ncbi:hypothetical protein CV093_01300 [Oceanobacillus sp. 143]|uniref:Uncharacterized protein n=1 Tax=Oceanobacillus zhaokaii TaxID=2052660 RepID=A0A345PCG3_9BACI|nr:hypothetical protein [Oceanobacillus zhaokaii]AXI07693.1 hypothetical protein CUC15_01255 [Oceanobacillus zhaokaii]QGS67868.1 hypothetical protein CV093_01300 [Oceanobacillus sp. 143]
MKSFYKTLVIILMMIFPVNYHVKAVEEESNTVPLNLRINMLPWQEVTTILPNKTTFTIIDFETGLSFHVQRRAGKSHADVQPLTKKDTKTMKEIYNNKWSWKRRAVIVKINDQLIAASMHGMPHGAGALNNGFPGHFCVHFIGSTTHRSNKEDPAHKIMILKAGNQLDNYLSKVNPQELIQTFAVAINQEDDYLLDQILTKSDHQQDFNELVKDITRIDISEKELLKSQLEGDHAQLVKVPVVVKIMTKEDGRLKKEISFTIQRIGLTDRWLINRDELYEEFIAGE